MADASSIDYSALQIEVDDYKRRLAQYRQCQSEIEELLPDEAAVEVEIQTEGTFDDQYKAVLVRYSTVLAAQWVSNTPSYSRTSHGNSSSSSSSTSVEYYKLPKVTLPKFKGDLLHWLPFKQSFDVTVDSLDIAPSVKLTILMNHLEGDAKNTVKFYTLVDDNYIPAKNALIEKYGDKNRLIEAYVEQLLNIRTSENMSLRQLYDLLL